MLPYPLLEEKIQVQTEAAESGHKLNEIPQSPGCSQYACCLPSLPGCLADSDSPVKENVFSTEQEQEEKQGVVDQIIDITCYLSILFRGCM